MSCLTWFSEMTIPRTYDDPRQTMKVTLIDVESYRGFRIGYAVGLHGFRAAWRSSLVPKWIIGGGSPLF